MKSAFFIKANVFGKTRYWCHTEGLHTGRKKSHGFSVYETKNEAEKTVKQLRKVFYHLITFEVLHTDQLPFHKKLTYKTENDGLH